jgi:hypothetical protein
MLGTGSISRWAFPALAAVFLGTSVYSGADLARERRQTEELSATNTSLRASLSQVQNQLQLVSNRLDQLGNQTPPQTEPPRAEPRPVAPAKPASRLRPRTRVIADAQSPVPKDDPRWNDVQSRLSQQQEQLDSTRQQIDKTRDDLEGKLSSSHDELSGSITRSHDELSGTIAKNHDELVALQKLGEKNYYEFEIDKSKQFKRVGPLSVSLRKVNQKHKYYDLALMVDDQQLEKKHVNLYEPMMFSNSDRPQPVELVVNEIHDNVIKGYISEPKYKKSELAQTHATPDDAAKALQQR